jgi:hypothetical protein
MSGVPLVKKVAESDERKVDVLLRIVMVDTPNAWSTESGADGDGLEVVALADAFRRVRAEACCTRIVAKRNKKTNTIPDERIYFIIN